MGHTPIVVAERWQFWIDRGGTFTDCIGRNPVTGEHRETHRLRSKSFNLWLRHLYYAEKNGGAVLGSHGNGG